MERSAEERAPSRYPGPHTFEPRANKLALWRVSLLVDYTRFVLDFRGLPILRQQQLRSSADRRRRTPSVARVDPEGGCSSQVGWHHRRGAIVEPEDRGKDGRSRRRIRRHRGWRNPREAPRGWRSGFSARSHLPGSDARRPKRSRPRSAGSKRQSRPIGADGRSRSPVRARSA